MISFKPSGNCAVLKNDLVDESTKLLGLDTTEYIDVDANQDEEELAEDTSV